MGDGSGVIGRGGCTALLCGCCMLVTNAGRRRHASRLGQEGAVGVAGKESGARERDGAPMASELAHSKGVPSSGRGGSGKEYG